MWDPNHVSPNQRNTPQTSCRHCQTAWSSILLISSSNTIPTYADTQVRTGQVPVQPGTRVEPISGTSNLADDPTSKWACSTYTSIWTTKVVLSQWLVFLIHIMWTKYQLHFIKHCYCWRKITSIYSMMWRLNSRTAFTESIAHPNQYKLLSTWHAKMILT